MYLPDLKQSNGVMWCSTGFRLEVRRVENTKHLFMKIDDLNPQSQICGRFTRWDVIRIGFYFVKSAFFLSSEEGNRIKTGNGGSGSKNPPQARR